MSTRPSLLDDDSLKSIGQGKSGRSKGGGAGGKSNTPKIIAIVVMLGIAAVGVAWQLGIFEPSASTVAERQRDNVTPETLEEQKRQDLERAKLEKTPGIQTGAE